MVATKFMSASATRPRAHDVAHCEQGNGTLEKGLAGGGEDVEDGVVGGADVEGCDRREGRARWHRGDGGRTWTRTDDGRSDIETLSQSRGDPPLFNPDEAFDQVKDDDDEKRDEEGPLTGSAKRVT